MDIVRIEREGSSPLEIPAELVHQTQPSMVHTTDGERGYQLFLYKGEDSYIAGIRILTKVENESPTELVEVVDTAVDVENFFFVFEPGEHIPPTRLQLLAENQRSELITKLLAAYDPLVQEVLANLPAASDETVGKSAE